jgi:hypothetical protein
LVTQGVARNDPEDMVYDRAKEGLCEDSRERRLSTTGRYGGIDVADTAREREALRDVSERPLVGTEGDHATVAQ